MNKIICRNLIHTYTIFSFDLDLFAFKVQQPRPIRLWSDKTLKSPTPNSHFDNNFIKCIIKCQCWTNTKKWNSTNLLNWSRFLTNNISNLYLFRVKEDERSRWRAAKTILVQQTSAFVTLTKHHLPRFICRVMAWLNNPIVQTKSVRPKYIYSMYYRNYKITWYWVTVLVNLQTFNITVRN